MPFIFKRVSIQLNGDSPSENWVEVTEPGVYSLTVTTDYRSLNEDNDLPVSVKLTADGVQDLLTGQMLEVTEQVASKTFHFNDVALSPDVKDIEVKITGKGLIEMRRFRIRLAKSEAQKH